MLCVYRCCAYVCVSLQSYRNHESNENVFASAGVVCMLVVYVIGVCVCVCASECV